MLWGVAGIAGLLIAMPTPPVAHMLAGGPGDPLTLMGLRSPGERTTAELAKLRRPLPKVSELLPDALPRRTDAMLPPEPDPVVGVEPLAMDEPEFTWSDPIIQLAQLELPPVRLPPPPPVLVRAPPIISAAVPEPATWMMLLGGFAAIGVMLRRKSRAAQAA